MTKLIDLNVGGAPHHSVLGRPWTYTFVSLKLYFDFTAQRPHTLALELAKNGESVVLVFKGVCGLEIEDGFPDHYLGLEILDLISFGWSDIRIRVRCNEMYGNIRFWAYSVERRAAQPGVAADPCEEARTVG